MSDEWGFVGWYYEREGQRIGPLSSEELVQLLNSGQLKPTDEVLKGWKTERGLEFFHSRAGVVLGHWSGHDD